ncbi:ATP-binding cassette domain-containing protein [Bradyrhizobium canariense]|nr:ATP-binding cassette domain-containing protein [Bradyrhizobium canariense]
MLSDLSAGLKPGTTNFIAGRSGAGKSTLTQTSQRTIPGYCGLVRVAAEDLTAISSQHCVSRVD